MKNICKHCGKEFKQKVAHYRFCKDRQEFLNALSEKFTEDYLREEYLEKHRGITSIAEEHGLEKANMLYEKFKLFGIPLRNRKEVANIPERQEKCRNTALQKYGTTHHLKSEKVQQKRINTLLTEYGVTNVFQREDVKEKCKQTNMSRRGVEHASQSIEVKEKVKNTCIKNMVLIIHANVNVSSTK